MSETSEVDRLTRENRRLKILVDEILNERDTLLNRIDELERILDGKLDPTERRVLAAQRAQASTSN